MNGGFLDPNCSRLVFFELLAIKSWILVFALGEKDGTSYGFQARGHRSMFRMYESKEA